VELVEVGVLEVVVVEVVAVVEVVTTCPLPPPLPPFGFPPLSPSATGTSATPKMNRAAIRGIRDAAVFSNTGPPSRAVVARNGPKLLTPRPRDRHGIANLTHSNE
jgi:hypothetical protein